MELDRVPLWRGNHVAVKQVAEDFASYTYLPRLTAPMTYIDAVVDGAALLTWERETFAVADAYDEVQGRYRGLHCGQSVLISDITTPALLVKPEVARAQLDADARASSPPPSVQPPKSGGDGGTSKGSEPNPPQPPLSTAPKRFHGTATLDATRVGRDAGKIADEVISHLAGLVGAKVNVTLEIEAEIPSGAPDHVVRTVTENSITLKLKNHGFEEE